MAITDYDKAMLLLPMSGANNGTSFVDYASTNQSVTRNGSAKTVTSQSKFYGSSGSFAAYGDYLSLPSSVQLNGSGNFVVEAWVYISAYTAQDSVLFHQYGSGSNQIAVVIDSTGLIKLYSDGSFHSNSNTFPTGAWHHIAFQRSGSTYAVFLDGTSLFTATVTLNPTAGGSTTVAAYQNGSGIFDGFIQDFCIRYGVAPYTTGFTPPTSFMGTISGNVKDSTGSNAIRNVMAFPRTIPTRVFTTTSDSSGNYSVTVPATECSRLVLDSATTAPMYNDIVDRVIAQ